MKIKAIGFDFSGVISNRSRTNFVDDVCNVLNISKAQYAAVYYKYNAQLHRGEINWLELWKLFLEDKDINRPEQLDAVMNLVFSSADEEINKSVLGLVDKLRKDYRLGLLSNNTIKGADEMRKIGLDQHFDVFHISAETKLVKPQAEAYKYFADCLGVDLPELVFIDDSQRNLEVAEKYGFTPIFYQSYDQLISSLNGISVLK